MFGIDCTALFSGEVQKNDQISGNMRRIKFYLCENCGNLVTSAAKTSVYCCGKALQETLLKKADQPLSVELAGEEYYVSSSHEMTRDHYITFAALISSDTLILRKLYPEWDLQLRLPRIAGGMLVWHCSRHGLFYQNLPQPVRRTVSRTAREETRAIRVVLLFMVSFPFFVFILNGFTFLLCRNRIRSSCCETGVGANFF